MALWSSGLWFARTWISLPTTFEEIHVYAGQKTVICQLAANLASTWNISCQIPIDLK